MRRLLTGMLALSAVAVLAACSFAVKGPAAKPVQFAGIIPAPARFEAGQGTFAFGRGTAIVVRSEAGAVPAGFLKEGLKKRIGLNLAIKQTAPASGAVVLETSASASVSPEGYVLAVGPEKVTISAPAEAGLFYGVQSLLQMIDARGAARGRTIPCARIEDQPRFGYRGLMLDESRHFFGKETVKQCLDQMAYLKLNRFHWHLTDSAGWRIEIKKYPKLTEIGGIGNHTEPDAPARFYTQDDIREIVAYARLRQITIIPEIDMPGHASAATRAYPEFSGGGSQRYPGFTFNPGSEKTYGFLEDVLGEVAALFPGPYIHLGGDEVSFGNQQWDTDPQIVGFRQEHGLKDKVELEHYFIRRMAGAIEGLGKVTMGWDEITSSQVPPDKSVLFWWRHDKRLLLRRALQKGYRVVLCPRAPLYFDFIQLEGQQVGRRPMFNDLARVYNFPDPIIKDVVPEGTATQIQGVQACVWTESIAGDKRLKYMTFPRIAALAEDAWTPAANKNYDDFLGRVRGYLRVLDREKIHYFDVFDPARTPEPPAPERAAKPLS
ncbi:MAG: beta-N-acetylhexosaminidase [Candidatus Sumerlaeia bacterium]